MCGICGVISSVTGDPADLEILKSMNQSLFHRGPDDEGYYMDAHACLAMRRLSIIDLVTGQQPIANETGDVWLVYNGEIYNYHQVRTALEQMGHVFKTQSDTEIIVHAYEEYGDNCVKHFNGMFAFALWDVKQCRLLLARDRLGIKPLFYWSNHRKLIFGSELKAVITHPDVPRQIDLNALDLFLSLEYIPGPRTIFQDVYKLPPGHILVYEQGVIELSQYWEVPYDPVLEDEQTCVEILASLIQEAVRIRLMSDVPLGAFLSGGIDSSTVVGFMSQHNSTPVQTFSIGFEDDSYNELPDSQAVSDYFGTNHHSEILDPDITSLAEKLLAHLDEPLADTSILPTFLVSKLASRDVKVVLSGDGGDELFAGYDTYLADQYSRLYEWIPGAVRSTTFPTLATLLPPQPTKKGFINKAKRWVEGGALEPNLHHARWMVFLNEVDKAKLFTPEIRTALDGSSVPALFSDRFREAEQFDRLAQQQYVDVKTYLADDILTKVDRMSMAVSIEARVPLLDYHIVEFALNLPPQLKMKGTRTKIILRKAVQSLLPETVLKKTKQGFSIPMKHWLRSSLKPMMQDLLSVESIRRQGYFNSQMVTTWVQEHLDGRMNHSHRLWSLIVFQHWYRTYCSG
jgi:asparagine synthase (glutamine-hydrolysing)